MWEIGSTVEFGTWVDSDAVDEAAREDIRACLIVLRQLGPALGRPLADTIKGARHPNLKELRVQSNGRPIRILRVRPHAQGDPSHRREQAGEEAILRNLRAIADRLFERHLEGLKYGRTNDPKRKG